MDALSWLIYLLLVPADHPLVKLWAEVDWAAINRLGQEAYKNSQAGQRAWAPAQMIALLLLYFMVPAASEAELLRHIKLVPLYRWFCGLGLLSPALDQHQRRTGHYPDQVVADSAQDYDSVHRALAEREIQAHIASRAHRARGGGFGADRFTFNDRGELTCPAGELLQVVATKKEGRQRFRAPGSVCAACASKAQCLPQGQQPDGPRTLELNPAAHQHWLQNRENTHTAAYKAAQRQRFASEGLFGLARRLHQADKMPYRSEAMNHIAGIMIAVAMNLTILARHR